MSPHRTTDAEVIAAELAGAQSRRERFAPLRVGGLPLDLPLAYAVQGWLVERLRKAGGGEPVGYKVGLTNPAMWSLCGVDSPVVGVLLSARIHASNTNLRKSDFAHLGIESEMALRLARSVDPADADRPESLLACVRDVHAAFELIDDRNADYGALDAGSVVAENSWNAGVVLGPPRPASEFEDLRGVAGTLAVNGETVGRGMSDDVLGSPLIVLGWLARALGERGQRLQAGDLVMTGAIVPTRFPAAGDRYRFQLEGLPPVELDVR